MPLKLRQIILISFLIALTFLGAEKIGYAQERLQVRGYGNTHFMDHAGTPNVMDDPNTPEVEDDTSLNDGFFQLREFSLFFDFLITDEIIASTEIEAADNGNTYTANYAYIDIQVSDNVNIRAGKILVPFLSYNENKPSFKQNLMSQPFTAFNIAPVIGAPFVNSGFGWSDAGAVLNLCCLGANIGFLDLKLAMINGLGSNSDILDDNTVYLDDGTGTSVRPRDGLIQNETSTELRDNNNNKALVGKLTFKAADLPFDMGISWYQGKWDKASSKNLRMAGAHLNWVGETWTLKGEYVKAQVEQNTGPGATVSINTATGDYNMQAWYVEGSVVPARYQNDKYLRLIVRYDDVDTNDKVAFTPWDRSRITAGMEWQFAHNTRFRYEWQRHEIDDFENAPSPYKNAGGEERIKMHMVSLIFSF
ncbi:hypothetical protein MNBD_NITROSPIRAE01-1699 [hydrothermal vent metagenome]|uniref:Porin n=1 Tax=hydrothermal vent metagenome TaxID=652676 RepID=A0A3B1C8Y2_9ZZZZ